MIKVNKFKNPMANWAQDDLLEHIQPEYHTMPFSHSLHLVAKKRCLKFTQNEFTCESRKRDYSEMSADTNTDPAKVRKATSVPRRQPEKDAISEFVSKWVCAAKFQEGNMIANNSGAFLMKWMTI